jgi:transposase
LRDARPRKPYPSDVSDEEWSLVVSYLTLMKEDAPQHEYPLRELFNALRYVVRYGIAWRVMPNDFPPWHAVHQQTQRWLAAGVFETLAQDLRAVLRLAAGRSAEPTASIMDSRTLRSAPESSIRAGYDGAKRKRGSKVHMAADTLGHLLALHVTPADVGDREAVARLAVEIQDATGDAVSLAYVDQGYTGEAAANAGAVEGIKLEVASCLRPNAALSSCLDGGSSSDPLPGLHVVADSPRITSAMQRPSLASTSSPSSATCSNKPFTLCKVYNGP